MRSCSCLGLVALNPTVIACAPHDHGYLSPCFPTGTTVPHRLTVNTARHDLSFFHSPDDRATASLAIMTGSLALAAWCEILESATTRLPILLDCGVIAARHHIHSQPQSRDRTHFPVRYVQFDLIINQALCSNVTSPYVS